jgi:hypothetical protein
LEVPVSKAEESAPMELDNSEANAEKLTPMAEESSPWAEVPVMKAVEGVPMEVDNSEEKTEEAIPPKTKDAEETAVREVLKAAWADNTDGDKQLGKVHFSPSNLSVRSSGLPMSHPTAVLSKGGNYFFSNVVSSGGATYLVTSGGSHGREPGEAVDLSLFTKATGMPSSIQLEEEVSEHGYSFMTGDILRCNFSHDGTGRTTWGNVIVDGEPFEVCLPDRPSGQFVIVWPCEEGNPWRKQGKGTVVVHVSRLLRPAMAHKHFNIMEVRCTRPLCLLANIRRHSKPLMSNIIRDNLCEE